MKNIALVLALSTFCFCAAQAQDLPNDLTPISQADAPTFGTYYSIAYWPDLPPLFWNAWDSSADLYYSPTYGTSFIWVDDRAKVAGRMLTESSDPPPIPGDGDPGGPDPGPPPPGPIDYGTNLWISLDSYTNAGDGMTYFLTIHNTSNAPYEIISSTNVAAPMNPTNWYSEGVWLATSTNLSAYVPMGSKTNRNFFRAHLWTDFTYGVPTNGQVFMQSATNNIYPVINGVTNHLTPFASNWFVLQPRPTNIYALNLGYAAEDFGFTNSIVNTNPPQQILRFVGFSKTITNLCLSSNLLTTLNISGWPALQDIEAWHNLNMLTVYVTNCLQLRRACFEAINTNTIGITNVLDFSGCIHLEEIRAADNRFPNVLITNGAGPELWHLCVHDNNTYNQLPADYDFNGFPSLRDLWIWDNQFNKALLLSNNNSTNLASVEVFNNHFPSADFSGQTNLDHILIDGNPTLTNLIVSGCTKLKLVDASGDGLSTASVDLILSDLDLMGLIDDGANNPEVHVAGGTNGIPSLDGLRHAANLFNKGWDVGIHLPPSGTPNISSIAVPSIGSNSATITWTTDVGSDSTVYYSTAYNGNGGSYLSTNVAGTVTSHSVTVTGLTAATNYYFFVRSTSGPYTGTSGDYQFTSRGGPGIYFVSTSSTIKMELTVTGSPTITWLWGDGTSTLGGSQVTHNFSSNTTSYVVVNPSSSLLAFGVQCQSTYDTLLSSVKGLTNYPNLRGLYLYLTGLGDVSLAGCTNLTYAAMVGCTNATTNTVDAWFNDLALAQTNIAHITGNFTKCNDSAATFTVQRKLLSPAQIPKASLSTKDGLFISYRN